MYRRASRRVLGHGPPVDQHFHGEPARACIRTGGQGGRGAGCGEGQGQQQVRVVRHGASSPSAWRTGPPGFLARPARPSHHSPCPHRLRVLRLAPRLRPATRFSSLPGRARVGAGVAVDLPPCRHSHRREDPNAVFTGAERIVAVGDVHGGLRRVLPGAAQRRASSTRRRTGPAGRRYLVQTGDVLDRGPDSRKVMDLLMKLQTQAAKKGGRVIALLGNHEVMNLVGDLRYVLRGRVRGLRDRGTPRRFATRAFELLADPARKDDPEYRKAWDAHASARLGRASRWRSRPRASTESGCASATRS